MREERGGGDQTRAQTVDCSCHLSVDDPCEVIVVRSAVVYYMVESQYDVELRTLQHSHNRHSSFSTGHVLHRIDSANVCVTDKLNE